MLTKIVDWLNGAVIFECECDLDLEADRLGFAVKAAVKAGVYLDRASLDRASLDGASLVGASLVGASLVGASLDGASLDGAILDGASLDGASLVGASLVGASLVGASLVGASLVGASLVGASLDGASLDRARLDGARLDRASLDGASLVGASLVGASLVGASLDGASLDRASGITDEFPLPEGVTFGEFKKEIMPQLLTAGGKTIEQVVASGAWDCHEWANCPMHVALNIDSESQAPPLLRPWVKRFVQLFDSKLIPCPTVAEPK